MQTHEDVARDTLLATMPTSWPELPYAAWNDTKETVHRWTQVIGKIKLGLTPVINHWWNVGLYASPRGLTTGTIPYGERWFDLELDFVDDYLHLRTGDGGARSFRLERSMSVADFYRNTMGMLRLEGIECHIWPVPVEIMEAPIRFELDDRHRTYDKTYALRFWRIVARATEVLTKFRARFLGKASPTLFFWGTFDLDANRYSGRRAPVLPNMNIIEREAYSHEVCAAGWWPGDIRLEEPSFFSYAYPEPPGFAGAEIAVPHVYYNSTLKGFYLPYDAMRRARDPEALLLDFCQKVYETAADLAQWNRADLERR
jgi:hypothetical protein